MRMWMTTTMARGYAGSRGALAFDKIASHYTPSIEPKLPARRTQAPPFLVPFAHAHRMRDMTVRAERVVLLD